MKIRTLLPHKRRDVLPCQKCLLLSPCPVLEPLRERKPKKKKKKKREALSVIS